MSEARVFIITLLAVRIDGEGTNIAGAAGASTILTVQISHEAAESEGWRNVYEKYPEPDGWFGHQVTVFELSDKIETDGYSVTLTITESGDAS